ICFHSSMVRPFAVTSRGRSAIRCSTYGKWSCEVTANGRTIDEWKQIASRDNHWLDTLVGCAVAMSLAGMQLPTRAAAPETQVIVRPKAPRVEAGQGRDRSEGGGLRDSFFVTAR
ncbi:MAG: hypothetical protein AAFP69_12135, partial [Planctomycetota bacterium]